MKVTELPYFGTIDFARLEEHYAAKTLHNGYITGLGLNFDHREIPEEQVNIIKVFLENIAAFDRQNRASIVVDFNAGGEVADYINFYLEEFDTQELSDMGVQETSNKRIGEQLLDKLRLMRVGLYPDGKHDARYYSAFDYSIDIDGETCNQLLVVKTKSNGNLDHITWES